MEDNSHSSIADQVYPPKQVRGKGRRRCPRELRARIRVAGSKGRSVGDPWPLSHCWILLPRNLAACTFFCSQGPLPPIQ